MGKDSKDKSEPISTEQLNKQKETSYRNGLEAGFAIAQSKIRKMAIVEGNTEFARKIRLLKLVRK